MKKRPLPLISLVLCAVGLSFVLLGSALAFLEPDFTISSFLAIGLFFMALVGVYIILKVFLVVDKLEEGSLVDDKKTVYVFCFVFLLVLLLALILLHLYFGTEPEKEGRGLIVTVAEEKTEETIDAETIENPPFIKEGESKDSEEYNSVIQDKPVEMEEAESVEEAVEPEIEIVDTLIPPTPVFEEKVTEIPHTPSFIAPERVLVPTPPTFVSTEEILIPSTPTFVSTEQTLVPSSPSFASVEAVLVPETPEIISVERTLIPSSPTFIEPVRTLVDEKVEVKEETDPWADFYVSGDSFDLFDGMYWFDLYINSSEVGVITVYIENGEVYISYPELKDYSVPYITEEAQERIFSEDMEWIDTLTLSALGVEVYADTITYTVEVDFKASDMPMGVISIKVLNCTVLVKTFDSERESRF